MPITSARRRDRAFQRTEAEQLDYEMELLRAQREGREDEFKQQEREKRRAKFAASLDAEMDDYFKSRPKEDQVTNHDTPAQVTDKSATAVKDSSDLPSDAQPTKDSVPDISEPATHEEVRAEPVAGN